MRGFTLIETLVVIAILGVAGCALERRPVFLSSYAYVLEETAALDSARSGLATALHDIREATYGDDGAYPVVAATSTLTFYADIDGNGSVERVRYYARTARSIAA